MHSKCSFLWRCLPHVEERGMNKDELFGGMKIVLGMLERNLGVLAGDATRINHARRLRDDGKVQQTMGLARRLIQRSLRRRTVV